MEKYPSMQFVILRCTHGSSNESVKMFEENETDQENEEERTR